MPHVDKAERRAYMRQYEKDRRASWKEPTATELREMFTADFDSGQVFDAASGERRGKFVGDGYRTVYVAGRWVAEHRVIWCLYHGRWPQALIDHIDGCHFNNRISNLREATPTENQANARIRRDNSVGIKGVSKAPHGWLSYLDANGKRVHMKFHARLVDAILARNAAVREHFGEFSNRDEWSCSNVMQLFRNATLLANYGCTAEEISRACDCHIVYAQQIISKRTCGG